MINTMYTTEINGVEVKTNAPKNLREVVPMGKGNDKNGYYMITSSSLKRYGSDEREQLANLVKRGYTTIRFERTSTFVRGTYKTIAYVK